MSSFELQNNNLSKVTSTFLAAIAIAAPSYTNSKPTPEVRPDARTAGLLIDEERPLLSWTLKMKTLSGLGRLAGKDTTHVTHIRLPLTPAEYASKLITPEVYRMWWQVGHCETHDNFAAQGPTYQGGFGIYYKNWDRFGLKFAPNAGDATPEQQMVVGGRILYPNPDAINITYRDWLTHDGPRFAPTPEKATPDEKRTVEEMITKNVPDQNGCSLTGW